MKKLFVILLALALILTLGGCAGKEETKKEEDNKTEEAVPEETAPEETVTVAAVPEELQGAYHEEIAGRGSLELGAETMTIDWSSSAFEKNHIDFPVFYDEENGYIRYEGAVMTRTTFTSDEESESKEIYNDGSGYFAIDEDRLIWHDDKAEDYDVVIFVRNDETAENEMDMINPWTYTTDIETAKVNSGVEFDPPVEGSLPDGFELVTYAANINGIISAEYESEDRILMIRKSDLYDGQVLSGDYNIYSENWQQVLKGLAIDCYGDGETVNLAFFGTDNLHFTVSCLNKGDFMEGNGLSADELNSLIMGMQ